MNKSKAYFIFSASFYMLQAGVSVVLAFLLQRIVDAAAVQDMQQFWSFLGFLFLVWPLDIVAVILGAKFKVLNIKLMLQQVKNHRMKYLFAVSKTPEDQHKTLSFFTADVDILNGSYYSAKLSLFHYIPLFVFSLVSLFFISWQLTLSLGVVSLLPMLTTKLFGTKLANRTQAYTDSQGDYVQIAKELLDNQSDIRGYSKEQQFLDYHAQANQKVEAMRSKAKFLSILAGSLAFNIGFLVQIVGIGLGSYLVLVGELTFGFLIATMQLVNNLVWPVVHGTELINAIKSTALVRKRAAETVASEQTESLPFATFEQSLELRDVSLAYGEKELLQQVNLRFEKHKSYAISAPSGYGKSSLFRAIAREQTDYKGLITLDGVDIRTLDLHSYHQQVRHVRQAPHLFTQSVRENIVLHQTDYSEQALNHALTLSGFRTFLSHIDLDTLVTPEFGLSGGEKQMIHLARALFHQPQILIMDELTANMDIERAKTVMQTLITQTEMTIIAITHEQDAEFLSLFDEVIRLDSL